MNRLTIYQLSGALTLAVGLSTLCGCNALHKRKDPNPVLAEKARISGLFVRDQILIIPDDGLTAGQVLGAVLDNIDQRVGAGELPSYYLTIARNDEVLYLPLGMVRDGIAASVRIESGDSMRIVNVANTVFGQLPDEGSSLAFPTLSGAIDAEQFAFKEINPNLGIHATPDKIMENVRTEINSTTGSVQVLEIINAVQIRRLANGRVHRMILPPNLLDNEDRLEQITGVKANKLYEKLQDENFTLTGGDFIEFTSFELIPEILRGRASLNAQDVVEQERKKFLQCQEKLQKSPLDGVLRPLTMRLEPISDRISATARALPGL